MAHSLCLTVGGDNEEDENNIVIQSAEEALLVEEQARIDDNEDGGDLEMEYERNIYDDDSDDGEAIANNADVIN